MALKGARNEDRGFINAGVPIACSLANSGIENSQKIRPMVDSPARISVAMNSGTLVASSTIMV